MKRFALCLLLLPACTPNETAKPKPVLTEPASLSDTCGAAGFQTLIEQPVTTLEQNLILKPVRIIRPGTAVTMDYREERINFEVNASERITRIYCG